MASFPQPCLSPTLALVILLCLLIPNWGNMTVLRIIVLASMTLIVWILWRTAKRKKIILNNPSSPTSGLRSRRGVFRGRHLKPRPAPYHLPTYHLRTPAMKRSLPSLGRIRSTPAVTQAKPELTILATDLSEHAGSPMPPPSEDSDTSRERQCKFPRLHRNRDTMPQMHTASNYVTPQGPRPGTVSPHSPRRPRERGRERQRDSNHLPNHRPNLRFNDHYQPMPPHRGPSYGNFRPQPLLEPDFPPWEAPYQHRDRRGRSPNGILGIPSQERPYRPAIRPRSKSQVDFSRNRPDLRSYVRPRQWRRYRGRSRPQNF